MASSTDRLQEIASSLVLADPRRPDQLADLARRIRELVTAGCGAEDASALRALVDAASGLESADDATRAAALAEVSACAERLLATESTAIAPRASAPVRGEDAQLVLEFVTEAQEHLAGAEAGLLALESDPHDSDSLNAVFRSFHTIKGVAGFLDLQDIGSLAHSAENLLDLARQKRIEFVGTRVDVTLEALDVLRELIASLSASLATGTPIDPHPRLPGLRERLTRAASGESTLVPATESRRVEPPSEAQERAAAVATDAAPAENAGATGADRGASTSRAAGAANTTNTTSVASTANSTSANVGFTILNAGPAPAAAPPVAANAALGFTILNDGASSATSATTAKPVVAESTASASPERDDGEGGRAGTRKGNAGANTSANGDGTVKVATSRLDSLINMVGELLTARLMVQQEAVGLANTRPRLVKNIAHLAKISRELQDLSMSMRMVPIQGVFQKMGRIVRDVARKAGKEVDFEVVGGETELDRNLVEAISDPLVHMVRNAADHGIEKPDERRAAGKPRAGRVELRAFHQAGNVVIQIVDDGRGLNRERILKKAVDAGLVTNPEELSDPQVWALIFHAGLSTAEKVTDISGRGVGMDVVKRNVEALRGRIDIESTPGRGSVFTIRLPLTLAMIDAMVVKVGNARYILPMSSVERTIRPRPEQISTVRGKGEMCLVRGSLLPLFRLHRLFGVEPRFADPTQALGVLVQSGDRRCCVVVDELVGIQQVIIKSLGEDIAPIQGICGGAILGDGCVSLIVDVPGLVDLATYCDTSSAAAVPNHLS